MSFIFGGNTDMSYEELQRKRALATQLARASMGNSKNVGEGLSSIARALTVRGIEKRTAAREKELQAEADDLWGSIFGGMDSSAGTPFVPSPAGAGNIEASELPDTPQGIANDAMAAVGKEPLVDPAARELLAKTLMAEAGGEGFEGMLAAGTVIANRANANGGDWEGTIMAPGQFSAWNRVTGYAGGQGGLDMNSITPDENALRAADAILAGQTHPVVGQSTHYYNPAAADPAWGARNGGNWTRIGNHVFGSAEGGVPRGGAPRGGGSNPNMRAIVAAMSNPMIRRDPGKMAVLQALLGRAMERPDPKTQVVRGSDIGFGGELADAYFNQKPDGSLSRIGGGGVTVNAPPTPAPGYRNVFDSRGNLVRQEEIPGGPAERKRLEAEADAAREQEDADRAGRTSAETEQQRSTVVTDTTEKIRKKMKAVKDPNTGKWVPGERGLFDLPETGIIGGRLADSRLNQEAVDVDGMLDTLKGMVVFDRLEALKKASATGASGLGQVTEREIALLGAQLGALEINLSPELILETLDTVDSVFGKLSPEAMQYLMGETDAEPWTAAQPEVAPTNGGIPTWNADKGVWE